MELASSLLTGRSGFVKTRSSAIDGVYPLDYSRAALPSLNEAALNEPPGISGPAGRVAVYTHKDPARLVQQLAGERIHKAESIEIRAIDRPLLDALVARLDRRTAWELAVSAGHLYLTTGGEALNGAVEGHALTSPGR